MNNFEPVQTLMPEEGKGAPAVEVGLQVSVSGL
jgi:hypothetical protein